MRINRFWQPTPRSSFGQRPSAAERFQRYQTRQAPAQDEPRDPPASPSDTSPGDEHDDGGSPPAPRADDVPGQGHAATRAPPLGDEAVWPPDDEEDLGTAEASAADHLEAGPEPPGSEEGTAAPPRADGRPPEPPEGPPRRGSAPIPAALRNEPWAVPDGDAGPEPEPEPEPERDSEPEPAPPPAPASSAVPDDRADPAPEAIFDPQVDALDDVAVTIGRVVSIRGSVVWGALYDDDDGSTARAARMGALVTMKGPDSRVFGIVNALERDQQAPGKEAERTIFEVQVLGEISNHMPDAGFQRGVSSYPPLDAPVTTVTLRDLALVYARPRTASVHVGRLRHNPKVPAFVLTDSLLGKHFAILGTTGSGKSCAVTVILRSILDDYPNGHVILLDPHNEYATAFADRAELLNPSNLRLPYWLLNFEEIAHILIGGSSDAPSFAQLAILKDAILKAKRAYSGQPEDGTALTVDTPVPYRLSDLTATLKEGMGKLNKSEPSGPYLSLIARIESLRADHRYAFMFDTLMVRDTMKQILGQLLRIPVEGKPITIIDISGVPSEIVDVVVSVLFRLTFELSVWSERGATPPVLLVCEEAHRYVPAADDAAFAPTKQVISRIAKEGRKYGVTLCLVSQRPSELAIGSLAQCNTVFALRMSNEHDQAFVAKALSENARWLVDGLPSLNTQEAVVTGDGVTVPVHIRFKDLAPEHRPSSHDPSFSCSWKSEIEPDFLDRSIERWRKQTR